MDRGAPVDQGRPGCRSAGRNGAVGWGAVGTRHPPSDDAAASIAEAKVLTWLYTPG